MATGRTNVIVFRGSFHGRTAARLWRHPGAARYVGERLAEAGITVYGPLLPGHGTSPEDMAKTTAYDWVRATVYNLHLLACLAAQMNAELLAGLTLAQVAHPGAPLLWSPLPLVFDMRCTAAASGYAEIGVLMAIFVQLAKFYRLPAHCLGMLTDAVIPDAQASLGKVLVSYPALLARPHRVGGVGGLSAYGVSSMEQVGCG